MEKKNEILLRRRWKMEVDISSKAVVLSLAYVATALENLRSLGFVFEPDFVEALRGFSETEFRNWYVDTKITLEKMVGEKSTSPMYPNFPKQVMEASGIELWMNAMVHYFGDRIGHRFLPNYVKEKRGHLSDKERNSQIIGLAESDDFKILGCAIISSKSSLSEQDKEDLRFIVESYSNDIDSILPDVFPHKENLVLVACEILRTTEKLGRLASFFKTATDVLRLAVAMSDGDISLAKATKFRSFKRRERRLLLTLLENVGNAEEDMLRFEQRWVRLGERIHPGEYAKKFPNAFHAFDTIRNRPETIQTFNRRIERALRTKNESETLRLLAQRPGEFARRLDLIVRNSEAPLLVTEGFGRIVDKVSTRVLLQMTAHFEKRSDEVLCRVFFPKGDVGKMFSREDNRKPISAGVCEEIVTLVRRSLEKRFALLPPLGKIFVAPELDKYSIPMSQRSASKALKTIARGSRISLSKGASDDGLETVRFFLWWKEGRKSGRIDVDLSAALYSETWDFRTQISYTNLRDQSINSAHSGDITSAPNGACEYIDIDLISAKEADCRYIVMNIYSYSSQTFVSMPECFAGWMMRGDVQGGEVFEPSTVQQRFDLASDSKIAIPVVIDIKTREAIWCDLALSRNIGFQNNLEANKRGVANLAYAMANHRIPNLGSLFRLHAKARGEIVAAREEAEMIFSVEEGVRPEHTETIMSQYL